MVMGLGLLPRKHFLSLSLTVLALLAGGVATSFIVADIGRMFIPLTPLVAWVCAQLVAKLHARKRWFWIACLGVLVLLQAAFSTTPRVFFTNHGNIFNNNGLRFVLLLAGLAYTAGVAWVLRDEWVAAWRTQWAGLRASLRPHGNTAENSAEAFGTLR